MKICFLSAMHPPYDKRVFDKEALTLAGAGFDVMHLCPGDAMSRTITKDVCVVQYPKAQGIRGRLMQMHRLYKLSAESNADVIHCNEVDSWMVGIVLKLLRGKKCVFDVHEDYPSTFAESRFPRWLRPAVAGSIRTLFRILTPATDRIVLAKHSVDADFHCAREKKILVRNYTPISAIRFASRQRRPKQKGDLLRVVHLGLFSKVRGWPQTLQALALAKARNLELMVVGEINDGSAGDFVAEAKRLGLLERIVIRDWMPFEDAFTLLCEADIGLIAFQPGIQNHVYAMPHKMFDYMAAGMAVICPNFAQEVAPIVGETACGLLVNTGNPQDIADAFDRLASDPAGLVEMGKRGQEAVRRQYNWEAEGTRLISMYKDLEATS